jgi:hypothetical protein
MFGGGFASLCIIEVAPVNPVELVCASLLGVLLFATGGYYGWRQIKQLRRLRFSVETLQDQRFLRTQAIRRLVISVLFIVIAGLLGGSYFLESGLPDKVGTAADEDSLYVFSSYWLVTILLFLTILCLAAIDVLATRRFALRQLRQLHRQYEAIIAAQAARARSLRNGHS